MLTADWRRSSGDEAAMTDGLILLGFIALIFAILVAMGRKRLGIRATGRTFAMTVCGFAIAILILWATQRH